MGKELIKMIKYTYDEVGCSIILDDNDTENIIIDLHDGELKALINCRGEIEKFHSELLEPGTNKFAYKGQYVVRFEDLFERASKEDMFTLKEWVDDLSNEDIKKYIGRCGSIQLDVLGKIENRKQNITN